MANPKLQAAFRAIYKEYPYYDSLPEAEKAYLRKFVDEYHFGLFNKTVTHLHSNRDLKLKVSRARDSRRRCVMSHSLKAHFLKELEREQLERPKKPQSE